MSYYDASVIIDGSGNLNASTLIDQLDSELAIRRGTNVVDNTGSPDSTSSSTYTGLDTFTITGLEPTDLVDVVTYMWISTGVADTSIAAQLISSTGGGSYNSVSPQGTCPLANTGGEVDYKIVKSDFYGYTGTLTVNFNWRRSNGSGTIYSAKRYHEWTVQKRRT
jgi:hypothetical protein